MENPQERERVEVLVIKRKSGVCLTQEAGSQKHSSKKVQKYTRPGSTNTPHWGRTPFSP